MKRDSRSDPRSLLSGRTPCVLGGFRSRRPTARSQRPRGQRSVAVLPGGHHPRRGRLQDRTQGLRRKDEGNAPRQGVWIRDVVPHAIKNLISLLNPLVLRLVF